jgi:hypothetical protein
VPANTQRYSSFSLLKEWLLHRLLEILSGAIILFWYGYFSPFHNNLTFSIGVKAAFFFSFWFSILTGHALFCSITLIAQDWKWRPLIVLFAFMIGLIISHALTDWSSQGYPHPWIPVVLQAISITLISIYFRSSKPKLS